MTDLPPNILEARRRAESMVDAQAVTRAIDRVAVRVTVALQAANPVLLCVMNGGLVYCGRLLGRLHFPLQLAYVHVTRYRERTCGGSLRWIVKPQQSVAGRQVLIVDDVLDDGATLEAVQGWVRSAGAARVWTTVLVRKQTPRNASIDVDFAALECPDRYLFGCGMDYAGYWRNLPAIYALPEDLENPS